MFGKRNTNNISDFGRKLNFGGKKTFGVKGSTTHKINATSNVDTGGYKKPMLEK